MLNPAVMKSGFVKHHPCQPAGSCSPWVRGRAGPPPRGPPSSSGGGSAGGPGATSARRPGGLGGEALDRPRRESESSISPVRGSLPAPWGGEAQPRERDWGSSGWVGTVYAGILQGYFLYVCITYAFLSKQTTELGALLTYVRSEQRREGRGGGGREVGGRSWEESITT